MSRLTQKAIMTTFLDLLKRKSFDKITVKDIIEETEINRNTFYYYYENIFDLVGALFREEMEQFQADRRADHSLYEELKRAAAIYLNNRQAVIHIYNSKSRELFTNYIEESIVIIFREHVRKVAEKYDLSEEGLEYITQFYTYAAVGTTIEWVKKGMPEYKVEVLLMQAHSFSATIDVMIQEFISTQKELEERKF